MPIENPIRIENQAFSKCSIPKKNILTPNFAEEILNANPIRKYAVIINSSNEIVTLVLSEKKNAHLNQGIPLFPYGSYEINRDNLYTGKISAICGNEASLVCFECIQ